MATYIDPSAKLIDSQVVNESVRIFRNAEVIKSRLGKGCSVGDDSVVRECEFGDNVIINRRSYVNNSHIADYTYAGLNTIVNYSQIGRFCSFGRNVDIGGFDHDMDHITTMPMFRFSQMNSAKAKLEERTNNRELCQIGSDVWIAAGANVLHKVSVGNGAVIGAGAVVTKDVPPYAIVAGVPARVIGYRFPPEYIERLQKISWWNWNLTTILQHMEYMIATKLTEEVLCKLEEISVIENN